MTVYVDLPYAIAHYKYTATFKTYNCIFADRYKELKDFIDKTTYYLLLNDMNDDVFYFEKEEDLLMFCLLFSEFIVKKKVNNV